MTPEDEVKKLREDLAASESLLNDRRDDDAIVAETYGRFADVIRAARAVVRHDRLAAHREGLEASHEVDCLAEAVHDALHRHPDWTTCQLCQEDGML